MLYALAVLLLLTPLTSQSAEIGRMVSLEVAMEGLYGVAAGKCDVNVANLKLEQEPCDLARRQGDDEHVYLVTPDKNGQPKIIFEGKMSETNPGWKVIYRKGEQQT